MEALEGGEGVEEGKTEQTLFSYIPQKEWVWITVQETSLQEKQMNMSVAHPKLVFPLTLCGNHLSFQLLCIYFCQDEER